MNFSDFHAPRLLACWAAVTVAALVGCGGEVQGPPTAWVSGTATLGGSPLGEAEVNFVNPATTHVASTITDEQGRFELEPAVGDNVVCFSKWEGQGMSSSPESGLDAGQAEAMGAVATRSMAGAAPRQLIPPAYANVDKSPLKFTVPEDGASDVGFDLPGE